MKELGDQGEFTHPNQELWALMDTMEKMQEALRVDKGLLWTVEGTLRAQLFKDKH